MNGFISVSSLNYFCQIGNIDIKYATIQPLLKVLIFWTPGLQNGQNEGCISLRLIISNKSCIKVPFFLAEGLCQGTYYTKLIVKFQQI
jgi:hypothetical protein